MGTQEAKVFATGNRMFDSNISQGTDSTKCKNACEGMTKIRKKAVFVYKGRIKNDRKERDQGRTGMGTKEKNLRFQHRQKEWKGWQKWEEVRNNLTVTTAQDLSAC